MAAISWAHTESEKKGHTAGGKGETIVEFKDDLFDEVGDIAVSWTTDGDCPLVGVAFVSVCWRVFDVC